MKTHITPKLFFVTVYFILSLSLHAQVVSDTIHVETAGTLSTLIPSANKYLIADLTLTGNLNGTDILYIREMAGVDYQDVSTEGKLTKLNLANANIVAGGDSYILFDNKKYYTENGVISDYMFANLYNLISITLPKDISTIGKYVFVNNNSIISIGLPDNLISINEGAFAGCGKLTSMTLPESITSIGNHAFSFCRGLTSFAIPSKITYIDNYVFDSCLGLMSVSIPESVTSIGNYAFRSCTALKAITIPDNVTSIGNYAFYSSGLTSITIPANVTSMGEFAFGNCTGLNTINLSDKITSIAKYVFSGCTALKTITIPASVTSIANNAFYSSGLTSITIPDNVTSIGEYAFNECTRLTSIILSNNLTSIKSYTFLGCTGLKSVAIPEKVTYIGYQAFQNCTGLTSVNIGNGVKSIDQYAFAGSGLTSVTLPNSVTSIGPWIFYRCSGLTSVVLSNTLGSVANYAFYECPKLESVTFPESVYSIGDYVFYNCAGLKSVTIPNSVYSIGEGAFYGCAGLTSITLPGKVTAIRNETFRGCTRLTSISIPNSVTSFGMVIFQNCRALTTVTIPNNVTSIGYGAFLDCRGLVSINIPAKATFIDRDAFNNCISLEGVYAYSQTPVNLTSDIFNNVNKKVCIIIVPASSIEAYRNAAIWSEFTNIETCKYKVVCCDTKKVGNYGKSTLLFEGNGFNDKSTISLVKAGQATILADTLTYNRLKCSVLFDFSNKEKGKWDIHVNFGDTIIILKEELEIEEYVAPKIEISLMGPTSVRRRMSTYYTINYTNIGNVDAYETPVSIQLTSTSDVIIKEGWEYYIPDFDGYIPTKQNLYYVKRNNETGETTTVLIPTIPLIPPHGSGSLTFCLRLLEPTEINVIGGAPMYCSIQGEETGTRSAPRGEINPNQNVLDCMSGAQDLAKDLGIIAAGKFIPGLSCAASVGKAIAEAEKALSGQKDAASDPVLGSFILNLAKTTIDCAMDLTRAPEYIQGLWDIINLITDPNLDKTLDACQNAFNNEWYRKLHVETYGSMDPNDKTGYRSPSGSTYYNDNISRFTYIINFENKPTATAPAREVFITDTLDLNVFDISTFRAGSIRIGAKAVQAPYGVQDNTWTVNMRPAIDLNTRVYLNLDKETGIAKWTFRAIDAETDTLPANQLIGFLPPNDSIASGQGCVSFSINLKDGIAHGARVKNQASIVFDYNDPIVTPVWSNTKDIIAPVSNMLKPVIVSDSIATLSWTGYDNEGGSGIYSYNVYAMKAGERYSVLLSRTAKHSIDFKYEKNVEYSFYVTATDSAGNVEVKTNVPDVILFKGTGINTAELQGIKIVIYPNPSKEDKGTKVILSLPDESIQDKKLVITTIDGAFIEEIPFAGKELEVKGLNSGRYIFTLQINNKNIVSQKVIIE
ncbi:leucine-rich repeat domain-containing protein [uncultured Bacteroides sp.]|uniref:leucine-rich repeat domain-containing protein n=1 Tax=uncultured Bacteroides sp. TaxID=162156 RepID=UPI002AAB310A|nr:leucine-rich repeat domain-containing protein [uncultured Bacteroides sp.]